MTARTTKTIGAPKVAT